MIHHQYPVFLFASDYIYRRYIHTHTHIRHRQCHYHLLLLLLLVHRSLITISKCNQLGHITFWPEKILELFYLDVYGLFLQTKDITVIPRTWSVGSSSQVNYPFFYELISFYKILLGRNLERDLSSLLFRVLILTSTPQGPPSWIRVLLTCTRSWIYDLDLDSRWTGSHRL